MFNKLYFDNKISNFLKQDNSMIKSVLMIGTNDLINEEGNFIKLDESNYEYVTYVPKSKYDKLDKFGDSFKFDKGRTRIKFGRFIRKFLTKSTINDFNITDADIEKMVNSFKSYFTIDENSVKIVQGDDILKWYKEGNYSQNGCGTLWNSCMRQHDRNKFLELYPKNDLKMIILLDGDKLRARALLWDNVIDNNGNTIKVMDRIYYLYDHDVNFFKQWASKNEYIPKWNQDSKSEYLFDVNGVATEMRLKIVLSKYIFDYYPYLDTFKYFDINKGILYNNQMSSYDYTLVQSSGRLEKEEVHEEYDGEDEYEGDEF